MNEVANDILDARLTPLLGSARLTEESDCQLQNAGCSSFAIPHSQFAILGQEAT